MPEKAKESPLRPEPVSVSLVTCCEERCTPALSSALLAPPAILECRKGAIAGRLSEGPVCGGGIRGSFADIKPAGWSTQYENGVKFGSVVSPA